MDNYPLPQPRECVDYKENSILINEGANFTIVDRVGRIYMGENCPSLAQGIFEELVQIEYEKQLKNSKLIGENAYGYSLFQGNRSADEFYIVNKDKRVVEKLLDWDQARKMLCQITEDKMKYSDGFNHFEEIRNEMGVCLIKEFGNGLKYWVKDSKGRSFDKVNEFENAFKTFINEIIKMEMSRILEGQIVNEINAYKIIHTKGGDFYIIDNENTILKKQREWDKANEVIEVLFRERALKRSVGLSF